MSAVRYPSRFIGMVVRRNDHWKAVRVRVQKLKRHEYLNAYYSKHSHYWAAEPAMGCQLGDIVEIKQLEEAQSDRVKHGVKEVVFALGNIIDPVTGRRCRGPVYIDEDLRKFGPGSSDSEQLLESASAKS